MTLNQHRVIDAIVSVCVYATIGVLAGIWAMLFVAAYGLWEYYDGWARHELL